MGGFDTRGQGVIETLTTGEGDTVKIAVHGSGGGYRGIASRSGWYRAVMRSSDKYSKDRGPFSRTKYDNRSYEKA